LLKSDAQRIVVEDKIKEDSRGREVRKTVRLKVGGGKREDEVQAD
jgi:hypothetical protein